MMDYGETIETRDRPKRSAPPPLTNVVIAHQKRAQYHLCHRYAKVVGHLPMMAKIFGLNDQAAELANLRVAKQNGHCGS